LEERDDVPLAKSRASTSGAGHTATDDEDVEVLTAEPLPCGGPLLRSHAR
jgi:hypothetical protein